MVKTLPVSRFAQSYNEHLRAAESAGDTIVLQQRGDRPAWVLEPKPQVDATAAAVGYLSAALTALLHNEALANRFVDEFTQVFPWVGFLPAEDKTEFVKETASTLRACASIGRFTALENMIDDWRNTAEIWSDPALASALTAPVDAPIDTPVD